MAFPFFCTKFRTHAHKKLPFSKTIVCLCFTALVAIVALRPSGIRVFQEDGSYNPVFVDSVTQIINGSSLPQEIKADKIRRSFSLRQPEKYSANPEYQKLLEQYPIIKEDEQIQRALLREIFNP